MNVTYTDKVKQSADGFELLQEATTRLEGIVGKSAGRVKAEWDRTEDAKHRPLYTLRLSDWTGAVSADFAPNELQSHSDVRYRLIRLWGDLLQVRSHKLLDNLTNGEDPTGE